MFEKSNDCMIKEPSESENIASEMAVHILSFNKETQNEILENLLRIVKERRLNEIENIKSELNFCETNMKIMIDTISRVS